MDKEYDLLFNLGQFIINLRTAYITPQNYLFDTLNPNCSYQYAFYSYPSQPLRDIKLLRVSAHIKRLNYRHCINRLYTDFIDLKSFSQDVDTVTRC